MCHGADGSKTTMGSKALNGPDVQKMSDAVLDWPLSVSAFVVWLAAFCTLLIYFDEAEQKRLIRKFWRCLNPEGYLFVGHAESLFGLTDQFHMIHQNNGTAYSRVEAQP